MSRNKSGKNRAAQKKANMKKSKKIIAAQKEQDVINRLNNQYTSDEDEDEYEEYDDDEYEEDEPSEAEVEELNYTMSQIKDLLREKPQLVPHCYELFRTMEEKRAEIEVKKFSIYHACNDPERIEVENLLKVVDFLTGNGEQQTDIKQVNS